MKTAIRNIIIIFAFIFFVTSAEAENSGFRIYTYNFQSQDTSLQKKYELAKIFYDEGRHVRALKLILPLAESRYKDKVLEIRVNLLIGMILNKYRDNRETLELSLLEIGKGNIDAIKFLNKALNLLDISERNETKSNNELDILTSETYISLAYSHLHIKQIDSSKYYLNKLISLNSIKSSILTNKAKAYVNLGRISAMENNLSKAEKLFLEAIKINEGLNNRIQLALAYNNLANIYVLRNEYEKAGKVYNKGLAYIRNGKSLKAIQRKEMLLDNIAWALYNLKDYRAYEYVRDSYAIRDSLKDRELTKELTKIKAENDVSIVKKEEENKRLKAEKKTWAVGIAGVIVSLLFLYIANLAKLRQRNLSLEYSQNELQQQKKLEQLKSQSQVKIINATIDGKETERKQIAEILHDNVSALLSSANMHLEASCKQFDGSIPLELQKTRQIIAEASEKIRDLSHNLMSSVLLKFGLEYAIKDVAKKFSNSDIKINTAIHNVYRYSQEFEIKTFNIIQELVNNILKHSNAKNAYIMMEEEYNNLAIIVKDDGEGFDNKTEEDKGIGLNQIEARIHMMNGTFLIESVKGEGTKASIRMPVVRSPKMHTA